MSPARRATSGAGRRALALALALIVAAACGPLPKRAAAPTATPTPTARDLAASVFAPREDPSRTMATPVPTLAPPGPASISRGSRLFAVRGCYICHGGSAEGHIGPKLAGTALAFDDVVRQVRIPRTLGMPPFPQDALPEDAIADIYNFLRSLAAR